MAVTTWEEALKDLTPGDVWAMRKIRNRLRSFLLSKSVRYTTGSEGISLERLEIRIGDTWHVYRDDSEPIDLDYPLAILFLALDEVVWSYDGELASPPKE